MSETEPKKLEVNVKLTANDVSIALNPEEIKAAIVSTLTTQIYDDVSGVIHQSIRKLAEEAAKEIIDGEFKKSLAQHVVEFLTPETVRERIANWCTEKVNWKDKPSDNARDRAVYDKTRLERFLEENLRRTVHDTVKHGLEKMVEKLAEQFL